MMNIRNVHRALWFSFLLAFFAWPARAQIATESALSLNGASNSYVQAPAGVWFNGDFTVEAWVYVRSYNSWSRLIDFANGPNTNNVYLALTFGTTGTPAMGVFTNNSSSPVIHAATQLPTNQWTHLAATLHGTTGTIYINGSVAVTGTLNVAPNVVRTNNYIGRSNYSADGYANADFEEIRIWNVARTQAQIQSTMDQRLAGTEAGLVGYWRCDDGSGTTLTNRSANGNVDNGTLLPGATWTNSIAPIPAPYALGVTNVFEGPGQGTDSVVLAVSPVAAPWIASANAGWLHLLNSGGNGATNFIFSFDTNSMATRSGTIAIGNQSFTVTQAGSTYVAASAPLTTLAGSGFENPTGVAVDQAGNVFIADANNEEIKKWTLTNNTVSVLVSAGIDGLYNVAVDGSGNVYYPNVSPPAVREWVAASNTVITVVSAGLSFPIDVAVDGAGNLYISDFSANAVLKWTAASNSLSTLIPSGLTQPFGVAVDAAGNVYVAGYGDNTVKKWTAASSSLSTIITNFLNPTGVAVDGAGNIYAATTGHTGILKWVAATGTLTNLPGFGAPYGVTVDAVGNVYIANDNLNLIAEQPRAFVDATAKVEAAAGGNDVLAAVLPATENLLTPFAPTNDQTWLNITGTTEGAVNFAFTSNPAGTNRTANLDVLGVTVPITQLGAISPPILTQWSLPGNGVFQFRFTNNPAATFTVRSSTNLSLPLASWTVVGTATNVSGDTFQFTSPATTGDQQRFYRVSSP
jgi:hypothetical protein